jgi:hypothetical protein
MNGIIRDIIPEIGDEGLFRRLRMKADGNRHSDEIMELFRATVAWGRRLIAPAAVCKTLSVLGREDAVVRFQDTGFQVRSGDVAALLDECSSATLMAATIGPALSAAMDGLMAEKRMTEAMVMDAFGSEAVEGVVNTLCTRLRESERESVPTRRFSPGYGDWDLSAQRAVLEELGAAEIGIGVGDSSILIPEKSVTAIMGWK